MAEQPKTIRKWMTILAILAICFAVGYGIGYLVGKLL